jgi:hypothetical protein
MNFKNKYLLKRSIFHKSDCLNVFYCNLSCSLSHLSPYFCIRKGEFVRQLYSQIDFIIILKDSSSFIKDEVYPICRKVCFEIFGEHADYCRVFSSFKYRYDLVNDVLFYLFRHADIYVKKEASVNLLTDP